MKQDKLKKIQPIANTILAHWTLCYHQYFLQSTLEFVELDELMNAKSQTNKD